jgi:hypothetical protein
LLLLTILVLLLAASDGLITFHVLTHYGVEAELNSLIRFAEPVLRLRGAIAFGIALPTAAWIAIAYTLHAPLILALLVAARAGFLVKQIEVHRPQNPVQGK